MFFCRVLPVAVSGAGQTATLSCFFFSSRRRHTRYWRDWSSDVCSSDLARPGVPPSIQRVHADQNPGLHHRGRFGDEKLNPEEEPRRGEIADVAPQEKTPEDRKSVV